jgi:CheY-like chemotaxis protein
MTADKNFTIHIHFEYKNRMKTGKIRSNIFQYDAKKKSVLIVDDNRDAADMLAILIGLADCQASVAYDSETGISLAQACPVPDIIFHDIGMPTINGFEVARILRRSKKLANTLLIAVTGYASPQDRDHAIRAGFDLHMAKPIEFEELKAVLNQARGLAGR